VPYSWLTPASRERQRAVASTPYREVRTKRRRLISDIRLCRIEDVRMVSRNCCCPEQRAGRQSGRSASKDVRLWHRFLFLGALNRGRFVPPIEPHETGMLDVGEGNLVYWEVCGNPEGKPALVVHGEPGQDVGPVGAGTSIRTGTGSSCSTSVAVAGAHRTPATRQSTCGKHHLAPDR
jgi:hypothetical protein